MRSPACRLFYSPEQPPALLSIYTTICGRPLGMFVPDLFLFLLVAGVLGVWPSFDWPGLDAFGYGMGWHRHGYGHDDYDGVLMGPIAWFWHRCDSPRLEASLHWLIRLREGRSVPRLLYNSNDCYHYLGTGSCWYEVQKKEAHEISATTPATAATG